MKTYEITYGSGLAWINKETIEVEDFEYEQDAVDRLIDKLETEGNDGQLIPHNEIDCYDEDQYVAGGNHGRCLVHYGYFQIEELILIRDDDVDLKNI